MMYRTYFGLTENPFSLTPDPRFLYLSERHTEGLAHLLYGMGEGGGFVELTGEVGTGKTLLYRSALEQIPEQVDVALILNPKLSAAELVTAICDELHVIYPYGSHSTKALNQHLLRSHAQGRRTVLIIDEAQNLDVEALEQVRLLTNLETDKQKLLQIILVGQPELRTLLARPDLRQLAQRITARYHLTPLSSEETAAYVKHRLRLAGAQRPIFTRGALRSVYWQSKGLPRMINSICERALIAAYADKHDRIDGLLVRKAAAEVKGTSALPLPPTPWLVGLVSLAVVGVGLLGWQLLKSPPSQQLEPPITAARQLPHPIADDKAPSLPPDESPAAKPMPSIQGSATEAAQSATELATSAIATPTQQGTVGSEAAVAMKPPADRAPTDGPEDAVAEGAEPVAAESTGPPVADSESAVSQEMKVADASSTLTETPVAASAPADAAGAPPPRSTQDAEPAPAPKDPVEPSVNPQADTLTESASANQVAASVPAAATASATAARPVEPPSADSSKSTDSDASDEAPPKEVTATPSASPQTKDQETDSLASAEVAPAPTPATAARPDAPPAPTPARPSPKPDTFAYELAAGEYDTKTRTAFANLFRYWGIGYGESSSETACSRAERAGLKCIYGRGSWRHLKTYDRPAVLELIDAQGKRHHVTLYSFTLNTATLDIDGDLQDVSREEMDTLWSGAFIILWQPPPTGKLLMQVGSRGEDVIWLRKQLDQIQALGDAIDENDEALLVYDEELMERVRAFQSEHGLQADGIVGQQTLMALNSARLDVKVPMLSKPIKR